MDDRHLLDYAQRLISIPSTSRDSNEAVAEQMQAWLKELGFEIESLNYLDPNGINKVNLVAKRGSGVGGLAYFGHNDCVPIEKWTGPGGPFSPVIEQDKLFGRGSCDMKGSLAAMLEASRRTHQSRTNAPFYFICTADEECGYFGAAEVVARSDIYQELKAGKALGIIGEPTRLQVVNSHKGSAGFRVRSHGVAAHSSTRHGKNANLAMIPFLADMKDIHDETESQAIWQNTTFDPPTMSWNIGINDGNTAVNITAPLSLCSVYFRPMPGVDHQPLLERARESASRHGLEFEMVGDGSPMFTDPNSSAVIELLQCTGLEEPQTVSFGTDACMFSDLESLALFGPGDIAQAHTDDEWIELDQLNRGAELYTQLIKRWCCGLS